MFPFTAVDQILINQLELQALNYQLLVLAQSNVTPQSVGSPTVSSPIVIPQACFSSPTTPTPQLQEVLARSNLEKRKRKRKFYRSGSDPHGMMHKAVNRTLSPDQKRRKSQREKKRRERLTGLFDSLVDILGKLGVIDIHGSRLQRSEILETSISVICDDPTYLSDAKEKYQTLQNQGIDTKLSRKRLKSISEKNRRDKIRGLVRIASLALRLPQNCDQVKVLETLYENIRHMSHLDRS